MYEVYRQLSTDHRDALMREAQAERLRRTIGGRRPIAGAVSRMLSRAVAAAASIRPRRAPAYVEAQLPSRTR